MSAFPALGALASTSVLGTLRSWLKARLIAVGELPEVPSRAASGRDGHVDIPVRVLVVDDNPVNLMLMSALLESRGLVPCLAADGAEAVALACSVHFDLILMDLQMPILDGLGATSEIRNFERQSLRHAVPVVAYSSTTSCSGVLASHGINGRLAKPCEDHELEDCLIQWCPTYRPAPAMHVDFQRPRSAEAR